MGKLGSLEVVGVPRGDVRVGGIGKAMEAVMEGEAGAVGSLGAFARARGGGGGGSGEEGAV